MLFNVISLAGYAVLNGYYGAGTGFIHLDDVQCTSSQTDLLQCSSSSSLPNCVHAQDAGVNCDGIAFQLLTMDSVQ